MGVLIMKTKITLISAATLMSIVPLFALNNTAQAADNSVKKTVMQLPMTKTVIEQVKNIMLIVQLLLILNQ